MRSKNLRWLAGAAIAGTALASAGAAQEKPGKIVPLEEAGYHVTAFKNDRINVFYEDIPPGRDSGYHTHTRDMTCVVITDYPPEGYSQLLGGPRKPPRRPARGNVSYATFYGKPPETHNAINPGKLSMHSICAVFTDPTPAGLTAGDRDPAHYKLELDNPMVRAWRLTLAPGQSVPAITQKAPGMRVIVRGGEIEELVPDMPARGIFAPEDHFYWQEAGKTRAIRNIGKTTVELVEYEFK